MYDNNVSFQYCSQADYTNFLRRPIPKRIPYPENDSKDSKSHSSIHEFCKEISILFIYINYILFKIINVSKNV